MTYMQWSNYYITGIAEIDAQHQHLVQLINQAAPFLASSQPQNLEQQGKLLQELTAYVHSHFRTEDQLMVKTGIDGRHLQHHRQSHSNFSTQIAQFKDQISQGEDVNGRDLLRFLSNWLAFHLLGEDQRMAREINAISTGATADSAYENIEGIKAEILKNANDALVNALVDLFAQMTEQNQLLVEKNQKIQAAHTELDNYRKTLEDQVNKRTQELKLAKDMAEATSRSKSRFLGAISHEFLTPLNAISGFAHLLEYAEIPVKQQQQAKHISRASQQLSRVFEEVLQFSRLDSEDIRVQNHHFSIPALLSQATNHIWAVSQKKSLHVTSFVDPLLPAVCGDDQLLLQALDTLTSNAVKFTDQGVINLAAHLLSSKDDQVEVAFEVIDTGMGIAPEQQNQLFQSFSQLDATTSRRHSGLGLGLVICARLVHLLGGKLSVESTLGHGSLFRISIWLTTQNHLTAHHPQPLTPLPPSSEALNQLKIWLNQNNMAANKLFNQLHDQLKAVAPEQTSQLAQHIGAYDFTQAASLFEQLLTAHPSLLTDTPTIN